MDLTGRTILITRAAEQADSFSHLITEAGGTPLVFPTIEISPPVSWESCDRAITSLHMYDGLILTSANGAKFFFVRMNELKVPVGSLKLKMICVVGEKTHRIVQEHGLTVTLMPEKFTAKDLAATLQQEDLHGKAFLFPRGNLAGDTLEGNLKILGANVDSVIVYQTLLPKQANVDRIKTMLFNDKINMITFTSPSTIKNFVSLFTKDEVRQIRSHTTIAVIGPVTAEAAEEIGLEPDMTAPTSSIEAFAQSIIKYFGAIPRTSKPQILR